MPGTYSQIYIQVVFAVKGRESLIHQSWEEQLYKYITGIVQNKEQKMLAINGMPDHIHFLIGMKPSCCLSDLIREVKKSSNEFIRAKQFFSISVAGLPAVRAVWPPAGRVCRHFLFSLPVLSKEFF